MSAMQVSSGYVLWKTDPEPIRHSHRERARLLTAAPTGIAKAHRRQVSSGRGIRRRRQYGGEQTPSANARSKEIPRDSAVEGKLFHPVPVLMKRLENSAEKAGLLQAVPVPKKSPGQGRLAALVPKRPPGAAARIRPHRKTPGRSSGLPGVLLCRGDYFFR